MPYYDEESIGQVFEEHKDKLPKDVQEIFKECLVAHGYFDYTFLDEKPLTEEKDVDLLDYLAQEEVNSIVDQASGEIAGSVVGRLLKSKDPEKWKHAARILQKLKDAFDDEISFDT